MQMKTDIRKDRSRVARAVAQTAAAAVVLGLTAWSAIVVKEATVRMPLARTEPLQHRLEGREASGPGAFGVGGGRAVVRPAALSPEALTAEQVENLRRATVEDPTPELIADGTLRWFDGRPVRPARTLWMRVTAYSPDARSCGKWADGQTATLHSVWTNGMRLVAADTRVLPFRSLLSVPGYADGEVVPVLDRGGAIKGMRLDLLMPTHEIARRWGVRHLPVTVWEYADE